VLRVPYEDALGLVLERSEADYASLRRGDAVLGIAPAAKLPPNGHGPGFTQERLAGVRGAGVETVLEVDDLQAALARVDRTGRSVAEPIHPCP
jgi:hypothetical protein